jgi:hypothetical protein
MVNGFGAASLVFGGFMSVQQVRRALDRFRNYEVCLTKERDNHLERSDRWEQAKTVEMWLRELEQAQRSAYIMAGAKVTPKREEQEWKGFVNYVLSEEDKAAYSEWDVDDHDLWLLVAGHEQCGYKLSHTYNAKNDTFNANYVCNDEKSPNKGYCLSAFAPDWYNAVKILAFKHEVVLDGIWVGKESRPKNNWG